MYTTFIKDSSYLSHCNRKPVFWDVWPSKAQTHLLIDKLYVYRKSE